MKHLKVNYCVTLDIPVYIDGPDEFDNPDYFYEVIEADPNGPRGWKFAHNDVLSAVMAALPMAEYVTVEVNDDGTDRFVDECPADSIRYDLAGLASAGFIRKLVKTIRSMSCRRSYSR